MFIKTEEIQICFPSKDGKVLLCKCVRLYGDKQLWKPESGKWIPIPIENAPCGNDAFSEKL